MKNTTPMPSDPKGDLNAEPLKPNPPEKAPAKPVVDLNMISLQIAELHRLISRL